MPEVSDCMLPPRASGLNLCSDISHFQKSPAGSHPPDNDVHSGTRYLDAHDVLQHTVEATENSQLVGATSNSGAQRAIKQFRAA